METRESDLNRAAFLLAKGVKLRGENGLTQSADGYYTANTDPADSLGVAFQLAQG